MWSESRSLSLSRLRSAVDLVTENRRGEGGGPVRVRWEEEGVRVVGPDRFLSLVPSPRPSGSVSSVGGPFGQWSGV